MTRLVLLHGFSQTGVSWVPVGRLLDGFSVHTPDLAGHGVHTDVVTDLWGQADLLATDLAPAVVVGYSMGARVALHLALAYPELVRGLVLLGGTAGIDDPAERRARRLADDRLARTIETDGVPAFLERWLSQPLFASLTPDPDDLAARRSNRAAGLASALRLAGTGTQDPPLWDRLGAICVPTLVLAGAEDPKFCALGERLAAGIGAPATFHTIPGAGHAAHLEAPETFTRVVQEWLADHALG